VTKTTTQQIEHSRQAKEYRGAKTKVLIILAAFFIISSLK
jgi:hypothetical protein